MSSFIFGGSIANQKFKNEVVQFYSNMLFGHFSSMSQAFSVHKPSSPFPTTIQQFNSSWW